MAWDTGKRTVPSVGGMIDNERNTVPVPTTQDTLALRTVEKKRGEAEVNGMNGLALQDHVMNDLSLQVKNERKNECMQRFNDVLKVNGRSCDEFSLVDIQDATDQISVASRFSLPNSIKFFQFLMAPRFIMEILLNGHFPQLLGPVPSMFRRNNKSYYEHQDYVNEYFVQMEKDKKIRFVSYKPWIVNPLQVAIQPNKKRVILDCSRLNEYIIAPKFKLDDFKVGLVYFKKGGWMINFDLKDGYHHVKMSAEFSEYLGFMLETRKGKRYGVCDVGMFGVSDMPWLFTKINRVLVKHWRSEGMAVAVYLDDGWTCEEDYEGCMRNSIHIRQDLKRFGAVWNVKKSTWVPTQRIEWIGFVWDSKLGCISLTDKRVTKIKSACENLLVRPTCTPRELAACVGKILSGLPVFGNCARLTTRYSQMMVAESQYWDETLEISLLVKKELRFWLQNVDQYNLRDCFRDGKPTVFKLVEGDASATGCGSILRNGTLIHIAARKFSSWERERSSAWRELCNIHFTLVTFVDKISCSSAKFLVDNQASARIVEIGSMDDELQWFASEIFKLCLQNCISLKVQWIPRELNKEADAVSRMADVLDTDDWAITQQFVNILEAKWGKFTLDAFFNYYNKKNEKFYSLFYTPGTAGCDAFTYDWSSEFSLLVPPVASVGRIITHLRLCEAKGVLVVPKWPSAAFWPLLWSYKAAILDVLQVKGQKILMQGMNENSIFGSNSFQGDMLAILMDFRKAY